ncbi:MAG: PAS domain-containing protein, partial [Thiohalomonadales bacterium]
MNKNNQIKLLEIMESSHDAELIASALRNAGYAVRPTHTNKLDDLDEAINKENWDIIIATPTIKSVSSENILEAIRRAGKDIICIIYAETATDEDILKFTRLGAAAIINVAHTELFLLLVAKEIANLQERRSHRECRIALAENEKRNRTLLDSSKEPISYIHEGMHIYANMSYLDVFGYDNADEMESIPIMDLISSDHQQEFKKLLRSLSKGETPKHDFEFEAIKENEEKFNAKMSFLPASFDGENCTQIVIRQKESNAELEKELELLRKQDLLTGLYNRQYFMDQLT